MMRFRRLLLLGLAVLVGATLPTAASAGLAQGPVLSYTGCFDAGRHDKQISELAVGDQPLRPCRHGDELIHLSGGDLTGLSAGVGLQGGGDNGELSLAIAPGYRLPQGCTGGEVPGWNGAAWACLDPASQAEFDAYKALLASAGTINDPQNPVQWTKLKGVPSVFGDGSDDAGGPAGGDLTGSYPNPELAAGSVGTAELAAGAVTTPKLADGSVTTAILADSAVTSSRIFDSTILLIDLAFDPATQAELDALGQPGTINAPSNPVDWTKLKSVPDGLADGIDNVNERPGVPAANRIATIDHAGSSGYLGSTSATVGADGLGLVTYFDHTTRSVEVAHCQDVVCSTSTVTTIDSVGASGGTPSVAIGADGLGLIGYYRNVNYDVGFLKVAHCENLTCSQFTLATPDGFGNVGRSASITIGSDGLGLISYYDVTNYRLKVAHCANVACSTATTAVLDDVPGGQSSSIAVGSDGLGLISYSGHVPDDDLKVAHCSSLSCSTATISTLDSAGIVGHYTSLTIGADGLGLVVYWHYGDQILKLAHCLNVVCSAAQTRMLEPPRSAYRGSVTVGADGLGLIGYNASSGGLKIAHCSDVSCSTTTTVVVDATNGNVGDPNSVTIGADGLPLVSYGDETNGNLKVIHCANVFCVPYFRRR